MTDPHIPFAVPDLGAEEAHAVAEVIRSGWITSGPQMRAFESEFSEFAGGSVESVAVNSATAGLHLVLEALGVGPGSEVIVPDWTFTATAEIVRLLGGTPVIVDIDPATLNIDLNRVADAVTNRTVAAIPVHFAGLPVNLTELRSALGAGRVAIVEDAAHALPASSGISSNGVVGDCRESDAAVFSFYATKTITTGEGGMITTRRPELARRCRVMRLHGIDRDAFDRYTSDTPAWGYDVVAAGFKYNMTDIAAAMGRVQLAKASIMREKRAAIASRYADALKGLPIRLPTPAPDDTLHAWHLYVARIGPQSPVTRDEFIQLMAAAGIGTSVHFIPLHRHTFWRSLGTGADTCPVADAEADKAVSLPIYSSLTESQVERIIDTTREILS